MRSMQKIIFLAAMVVPTIACPADTRLDLFVQAGNSGISLGLPPVVVRWSRLLSEFAADAGQTSQKDPLVLPEQYVNHTTFSGILLGLLRIEQRYTQEQLNAQIKRIWHRPEDLVRAYQAINYLDIPVLEELIAQELMKEHPAAIDEMSLEYRQQFIDRAQKMLGHHAVLRHIFLQNQRKTQTFSQLLRELSDNLMPFITELPRGDILMGNFNERYQTNLQQRVLPLIRVAALARTIENQNFTLLWQERLWEWMPFSRPSLMADLSDVRRWLTHPRNAVHFYSINGFFNLIHVGLTVLPPEIGLLRHLRFLTLAHNRLRYVPEEIGLITQLEDLDLCDNLLPVLPSVIQKLEHLSRLDISQNCFSCAAVRAVKQLVPDHCIINSRNQKCARLRGNQVPIVWSFRVLLAAAAAVDCDLLQLLVLVYTIWASLNMHQPNWLALRRTIVIDLLALCALRMFFVIKK